MFMSKQHMTEAETLNACRKVFTTYGIPEQTPNTAPELKQFFNVRRSTIPRAMLCFGDWIFKSRRLHAEILRMLLPAFRLRVDDALRIFKIVEQTGCVPPIPEVSCRMSVARLLGGFP
jgi:hypothetical protein